MAEERAHTGSKGSCGDVRAEGVGDEDGTSLDISQKGRRCQTLRKTCEQMQQESLPGIRFGFQKNTVQENVLCIRDCGFVLMSRSFAPIPSHSFPHIHTGPFLSPAHFILLPSVSLPPPRTPGTQGRV